MTTTQPLSALKQDIAKRKAAKQAKQAKQSSKHIKWGELYQFVQANDTSIGHFKTLINNATLAMRDNRVTNKTEVHNIISTMLTDLNVYVQEMIWVRQRLHPSDESVSIDDSAEFYDVFEELHRIGVDILTVITPQAETLTNMLLDAAEPDILLETTIQMEA